MELKFKKQSDGEAAAPKEGKRKRTKAAAKPKAPKGNKPSKASGKRFVIIIGDEGAIVVFMQGMKVVRRLFAPSAQPAHTEAISELMTANPNVPIYVLADVLDQQYIPHSFPPVSALSVNGLVKRRLDRDFQPDDLKGSLKLGRDKTGRKEWKFLLVALAKSALMSEWLDLLVELPNEMKGVYLVPIETVNYVAMLNAKVSSEKPLGWQLFISHNKVSGFRQVVIHDGRLVFTRVSQAIDDAIPAVMAGNIEQEIINTIEYLKRLEFRDNADLEAIVVISRDVGESIDMKRFGFGRTHVFSPQDVAETLSLEQAALSADRFGDVVMAAAFGISKKRMLRFATAYMDRLAKLYQARVGIRAAMALMVLLFVGMMGMAAVDMMGNYSKISEATQKTSGLQADLQKHKASVEGLNKDVAFKTALVATYDAYIAKSPKPEDFAHDIMPFISAQSRMTTLKWTYKAPDDKAGTAPAAPGTPGNLPVEVKTEFDFSGAGGNVDALSQAANGLMEDFKAKLTKYDVTAEPFPWLKEGGNEQIGGLEIMPAAAVSESNRIAKITFMGVKDVPTTPGAQTPPPPAPPQQ